MLISTLREEAAYIAGIQPSTKKGWWYATKDIEHLKVEEFNEDNACDHRRAMRVQVSPRTLKTRIGHLCSIWNWGINERLVLKNPWMNMSKTGKIQKVRHPELPFEHFKDFHGSPMFMGIWYHGFRVRELANISKEEIVLDAPIPYFDLRHTSSRRLKNDNSERRIPIYPDYLPFIIDGKLVVDDGWWKSGDNFSRYLKDHTGVSAHPIRHQFRSRLAHCSIEYSTQKALMGHLPEGMTAQYGEIALKTKLNALMKVNRSYKVDDYGNGKWCSTPFRRGHIKTTQLH